MWQAASLWLGIDRGVAFSLWMKAAAILFLCVFIPAHLRYSGPVNFLWLSDIGLFGAVLALLLGSRLLASMMLLTTLVPADPVLPASPLAAAEAEMGRTRKFQAGRVSTGVSRCSSF